MAFELRLADPVAQTPPKRPPSPPKELSAEQIEEKLRAAEDRRKVFYYVKLHFNITFLLPLIRTDSAAASNGIDPTYWSIPLPQESIVRPLTTLYFRFFNGVRKKARLNWQKHAQLGMELVSS